jgi:hypothetical protein
MRTLKFENLTIVSGEILRSTESRRICFSYDQNVKNIFEVVNFCRKEIWEIILMQKWDPPTIFC